jgi:hypothetical protein
MHLMHFSANAHSSAQSSSPDGNEHEGDGLATKTAPINGPAQANSTRLRESNSPGWFSNNPQAQPRPLPITAPQSVHEPAPLHHNNQQQQHHRHQSQHRYNDRTTSSFFSLPSIQARFPSHEPSQLPTPETYVEKGMFSDFQPQCLQQMMGTESGPLRTCTGELETSS